MLKKEEVLLKLDELQISYTLREHPPVYTIEEMEKLNLAQGAEIAKNLFLRDAKGKSHFLVVCRGCKSVNLAELSEKIGSTRLSFASEERLLKHLGLGKGSVSPLGLLNESAGEVAVVMDKELEGLPVIGVHPNDNRATVYMSHADLERIIKTCGNETTYIDMK